MKPILRLVIAVVVGCLLATVLPGLHAFVPRWIFRAGLLSMVAWWVVPQLLSWRKDAAQGGRRDAVEVTPEGDWWVIKATPAPLPKRVNAFGAFWGCLIAFLGTVLLPPHSAFIGSGQDHLIVLLVIGVPAGVCIFRWLANRTRKLAGGPFAVRQDSVRLSSGEVIPGQRLHQVVVKNLQDGALVIAGGTGAQGAALLMQAEARQRLAQVSHAVMLEHDGVDHVLASGLTLPQANAVFSEITRRVAAFQD